MKKDITRDATERATNVMSRSIDRLKERIPMGPAHVEFTDKEIEQQLAKAHGKKILAFMDMLGDDETLEKLRRARGT